MICEVRHISIKQRAHRRYDRWPARYGCRSAASIIPALDEGGAGSSTFVSQLALEPGEDGAVPPELEPDELLRRLNGVDGSRYVGSMKLFVTGIWKPCLWSGEGASTCDELKFLEVGSVVTRRRALKAADRGRTAVYIIYLRLRAIHALLYFSEY